MKADRMKFDIIVLQLRSEWAKRLIGLARRCQTKGHVMSIRPVKRIVQSKPTIEGAGVKLRRAFGFGDTTETRSVPAARRFPQRSARGLSRRLPVASSPRHRDHHLCAGRHGGARRQPGQSRHARRRRRAMDDRRPRHHAPGDAAGRRAGPHARLPALGQPARRRSR